MAETFEYAVPAMHCGHCKSAIEQELAAVGGVETIDVDLERKRVTVLGSGLSDDVLRKAIAEAGYEVAAAT